jgi:hypothetical protein
MDGVLVEFVKAAFKLHGLDYQHYPAGFNWDVVGAINSISPSPISNDEFWDKMDEYFWATISKTSLCDTLVENATRYFESENVFILTSTGSPQAASGKLRWIRHNLPQIRGNVLIGSHKHLLAGPDTLLIDDCDQQVDAFRAAGGQAILVPRPWNTSYAIEDSSEYVLKGLYAYRYGDT